MDGRALVVRRAVILAALDPVVDCVGADGQALKLLQRTQDGPSRAWPGCLATSTPLPPIDKSAPERHASGAISPCAECADETVLSNNTRLQVVWIKLHAEPRGALTRDVAAAANTD